MKVNLTFSCSSLIPPLGKIIRDSVTIKIYGMNLAYVESTDVEVHWVPMFPVAFAINQGSV